MSPNPRHSVTVMMLCLSVWLAMPQRVDGARRVSPLFRSGMEASTCANGVIEDAEQCDGVNLGGASCASIGLIAGTLACTGGCRFDSSACIANLPPSAADDAAVFNEDTTVVQFSTAVLTANDADADGDALALVSVSNPAHGVVVLQSPGAAFSVDANFNGTAGFDYTISDGEATDTAHVTLNVVAVNDPPVATPASVSTDQNVAKPIALSGSDIEGAALTFAAVATPTHGQLGAFTPTGPNSATVVYTPNNGYFGSDSFSFRTHDGQNSSAPAVIDIDVVRIICGDGLIRGTEECDDHNTSSNDGCSAMCLIESGFTCSGEPSICVPL
ncbi:MAG: tandem-95 repeat protein [Xanthomonadales bacterium]|nr:tandem-95 repeat protein [Xanthomonadales bacterium]